MNDLTPYHEDQELDNNTSDNIHFRDVLDQYVSRRSLITKAASGAVALTLASTLTGCNDNNDDSGSNNGGTAPVDPNKKPEKLTFTPVAKNLNDIVTVPEGYEANVIYALGDSLNPSFGDWDDNNIPSGPSFQFRSGDCHDGMHYFGLNTSTNRFDDTVSAQGLLVMNHEYINQTFLHPKGPTKVDGRRPEDEVIRETNAHGVSVVHIKKDPATQKVEVVKNSIFNRRITGSTVMDFAGAATGSNLLSTRFSPAGRQTRGTHNNCGNGYTPWGTYLTTEENFIGYFARSTTDDALRTPEEIIALKRYGLKAGSSSRYGWETAIGQVEAQDLYDRWNADVKAAQATQDYRNGPNTFGWMVEIDPFDNRQNPVKRTSLGRFAHEDSACRAVAGQPIAFYMGDDSRGEYIYKFVSTAVWDTKDINGGYAAGDKYMNSGKLYVAKFNNDGSGQWIELAYGKNGLNESNTTYPFKSQAEVVTFARLAADSVGATKMDRPEWATVNPINGEIYVTLTNNSNRGKDYPTDAANPRNYTDLYAGTKEQKGNVNGHIIRFREADDRTTAETFKWDIYLFGAEASMASNINLSGLTDSNDFSSPDGMWFDPRGVLWIETDDGAYTDVTNCMMLAALPGQIGDGGTATTSNGQQTITGAKVTDATLRRFLVGPKQCEITGIAMTPDYKAIFINVQHPGEDSASYAKPESNWPATQKDPSNKTARPRSATVVITRKDGGVIAG
ncbi:PhoX family phosphatase [Acinetobacter nosocomialis]|uniref:PhoX family protein n=1 Tax=Acinetobacter nosocomialis TaxID=106654 RepID=UPI000B3DDF0B|nr:PhoX family phosphatase [Acinetobacter nosocomialis]MBD0444556.1 PhoX family phosphatase [Acinetobacter nosocomialis]MDQ9040270.1 PhoX family phosphatase [Acinetobacter nosocomialis]MDR9531448.1 PhoX family phosphatase [Acinetobacter nosocomialis]OUT27779.1 Tat (twin-arginine translocation) pathway signal sequence domain protein [Acinetobacter nosocomialis P020]PSE16857.1 PhoX family phosphatase [Acinetobacter nosocomialis]